MGYNFFFCFLRMAGSYEALEAGNTGDALVDFTGGVCESISLKDGGYSQDQEKRLVLFKSMQRAMRDKSLIGASIRVSAVQTLGVYLHIIHDLYTSWIHKDLKT